MMKHLRTLGVVATIAVFGAACAVVPSYTASSATFEGFPVISHVPQNPKGIVFLFHGTNGSANFATKLETVDMMNHLVARGYGFVSTESTNRTTKQWNNLDLSLATNPDLARLSRLYQGLLTAGTITRQTPIYAIGMSQGAGFASVFGQAFKDAGYPIAAIAPSHGQIPVAVRNAGGLEIPALFALGANDPTVNNNQVVGQLLEVVQRGVPVELHIDPETPLQAARFLRVPGIDSSTATAIFSAAVNAGLYDSAGHRVMSIPAVEAALPTLPVPASVTADQKVMLVDETEVVLAVHVYSATYATQTADFFDAHR